MGQGMFTVMPLAAGPPTSSALPVPGQKPRPLRQQAESVVKCWSLAKVASPQVQGAGPASPGDVQDSLTLSCRASHLLCLASARPEASAPAIYRSALLAKCHASSVCCATSVKGSIKASCSRPGPASSPLLVLGHKLHLLRQQAQSLELNAIPSKLDIDQAAQGRARWQLGAEQEADVRSIAL